jgi:hypothetical protein
MQLDQSKRIAMNALKTEQPVDSHKLDRLGLIGIGWAVGKGYAAYRGDGTFALTFDGLSYINSNKNFLNGGTSDDEQD